MHKICREKIMENIAIKTQRNKNKLHHQGHLYIFHKLNADGDIKFWRCEKQKKEEVKCKGRLHTAMDDSVLKEVGNHTCEPDAANVQKQRIVTAVKRRAVETMETPQIIRTQVLQQVATPVLFNIPSKNALKVLFLSNIKYFLNVKILSKSSKGPDMRLTVLHQYHSMLNN
jgi:hypothetical protein